MFGGVVINGICPGRVLGWLSKRAPGVFIITCRACSSFRLMSIVGILEMVFHLLVWFYFSEGMWPASGKQRLGCVASSVLCVCVLGRQVTERVQGDLWGVDSVAVGHLRKQEIQHPESRKEEGYSLSSDCAAHSAHFLQAQ